MGSASPGAWPIPDRLAAIAAAADQEAASKAAAFRWDPVRGETASAPASRPHGQGRLNVLLAKGSKSLFSYLEDPRVRVFKAGEPLAEPPDLVVVLDPEDVAEGPSALDLPAELWPRLESGAAKLAIDSSGEGEPYDRELFSRIHHGLERSGVLPSNCIYLTQDRGFRDHYLADRRVRGLDGPAIEILVHDRYIQFLCRVVRRSSDGVFEKRLAAYAQAGATRERRFVCLNNKFRPVRLLFLLRLLREGLWDDGHISLGKIDEVDGGPLHRKRLKRRLAAIDELYPLGEELGPLLDRIEACSPRFIGLKDGLGMWPRWGGDPEMVVPEMFAEYGASWFSIVTETNFHDRLHRITEKAFKPLLCLHPMIVLGSYGSLHLTREFGFKTFSDHWDESYDLESDPKTRFDMVFEQVERLCRMEETELARLYAAAAETVVFNACWGLTWFPTVYRDHVDGALVDRLVALTQPHVAA